MSYGTNVFSRKNIIGIEVKANDVVRVNFDDNSHSTYSTVVWSIDREPSVLGVTSTEGVLHMLQDGAIQGIGFFGHRVSSTTPLIVNSVSMNNIETVRQYLITNL